jgi:hypothetical protein
VHYLTGERALQQDPAWQYLYRLRRAGWCVTKRFVTIGAGNVKREVLVSRKSHCIGFRIRFSEDVGA